MKCYLHDTKKRLVTKNVFDQQSQWENLKYEIWKFLICHSKVTAKDSSQVRRIEN